MQIARWILIRKIWVVRVSTVLQQPCSRNIFHVYINKVFVYCSGSNANVLTFITAQLMNVSQALTVLIVVCVCICPSVCLWVCMWWFFSPSQLVAVSSALGQKVIVADASRWQPCGLLPHFCWSIPFTEPGSQLHQQSGRKKERPRCRHPTPPRRFGVSWNSAPAQWYQQVGRILLHLNHVHQRQS